MLFQCFGVVVSKNNNFRNTFAASLGHCSNPAATPLALLLASLTVHAPAMLLGGLILLAFRCGGVANNAKGPSGCNAQAPLKIP